MKMQLSMWMIANQLANFDIETDIQKDAPIVLRSARRAYATECVHVMPTGNDVLCTGDGGKILIRDIEIEYAFEIIQSIFDTYDAWNADILRSAAHNDFQAIVNDSWHAFHSPIVLLNEDFKVLAMTESTDMGGSDEEWAYLKENGYSSYRAIKNITQDGEWRKHRGKIDAQRFHFPDKKKMSSCISAAVIHDNVRYGRINVLEKDRPLNEGDMQLLSHLARTVAPYLSLYYMKDANSESYNVFLEMLKGHHTEKRVFETRMAYKQWSQSDTYVVMVIDFRGDRSVMRMCVQQLSAQLPHTELTLLEDHVIAIVNKTRDDYERIRRIIENMVVNCDKYLGVSLPFEGLTWVQHYYHQAAAAIQYGICFQNSNPAREGSVFEFYDYAADYLYETASGNDCAQLCACSPDAVSLVRESYRDGNDERSNTLYIYLKNDCSLSRTAQEMHLHKNTLLYRLKKIMDSLQYPTEDKYSRDYLYGSLRLLWLYQLKYPKLLARFCENELDQD